jgi:hypothetical protein
VSAVPLLLHLPRTVGPRGVARALPRRPPASPATRPRSGPRCAPPLCAGPAPASVGGRSRSGEVPRFHRSLPPGLSGGARPTGVRTLNREQTGDGKPPSVTQKTHAGSRRRKPGGGKTGARQSGALKRAQDPQTFTPSCFQTRFEHRRRRPGGGSGPRASPPTGTRRSAPPEREHSFYTPVCPSPGRPSPVRVSY